MGGNIPPFKQAQAANSPTTGATSSGKGFSAMILPVYSVGVIVFLLYTLSKVRLQ